MYLCYQILKTKILQCTLISCLYLQRWMFSTSIEPIKSWKYTDYHASIAEHLCVCPYNQDKVDHQGLKMY